MAGTVAFLRVGEGLPMRPTSPAATHTLLLGKKTHAFVGSTTIPSKELPSARRTKNIFVYVKKILHYVFHLFKIKFFTKKATASFSTWLCYLTHFVLL